MWPWQTKQVDARTACGTGNAVEDYRKMVVPKLQHFVMEAVRAQEEARGLREENQRLRESLTQVFGLVEIALSRSLTADDDAKLREALRLCAPLEYPIKERAP